MSAFVTVMLMPLTYSIAYGLIGGIMVYVVMEGTFFILEKCGIEKPSYEKPADESSAPEDDKKVESDEVESPEETS
jgi:AGZA family xanthine/uracil permease-like MFS transporter